jgi:S1-C subfamily serine protease
VRGGDPVSPAAAAGIQPGDVIVSVDGTSVKTFEEASAIIQASPNRTIAVVVRRDGVEQTLQVTPLLAQQIAGRTAPPSPPTSASSE